MRIRAGLLGLVIGLTLSACQGRPDPTIAPAAGSAWKEVSLPEWGFRVSLPGTPREEKKSLPLSTGAVPQLQLILNLGDCLYLVSVNAVPPGSDEPKQAESLFDVARGRTVSNTHGTVLAEKPLTLAGGFRGRECEIRTSSGEHRRLRFYLARGRFYSLVVQGSQGSSHSTDAERFLDSFQLLVTR